MLQYSIIRGETRNVVADELEARCLRYAVALIGRSVKVEFTNMGPQRSDL